jgi:hypothetical protein
MHERGRIANEGGKVGLKVATTMRGGERAGNPVSSEIGKRRCREWSMGGNARTGWVRGRIANEGGKVGLTRIGKKKLIS